MTKDEEKDEELKALLKEIKQLANELCFRLTEKDVEIARLKARLEQYERKEKLQ